MGLFRGSLGTPAFAHHRTYENSYPNAGGLIRQPAFPKHPLYNAITPLCTEQMIKMRSTTDFRHLGGKPSTWWRGKHFHIKYAIHSSFKRDPRVPLAQYEDPEAIRYYYNACHYTYDGDPTITNSKPPTTTGSIPDQTFLSVGGTLSDQCNAEKDTRFSADLSSLFEDPDGDDLRNL